MTTLNTRFQFGRSDMTSSLPWSVPLSVAVAPQQPLTTPSHPRPLDLHRLPVTDPSYIRNSSRNTLLSLSPSFLPTDLGAACDVQPALRTCFCSISLLASSGSRVTSWIGLFL